MKKGERPIPLRSVVGLPRWLMLGAATLCGACMLAGLVTIVYGLVFSSGGALGGWVGGGLGCLIGGAGGLVGTLTDWHRRMPAPVVFSFLEHDAPHPLYRRAFWPALVALALGVGLGLAFGHWRWWQGLYHTGGILVFIAGSTEAMRRHTVRQARVVFALYADGLLAADETAAIEDSRRKDPKFDRAIADYQRVAAELQRMM